jgi:hypothetical protein
MPLQPHRTGVAEDDVTGFGQVLVQLQPGSASPSIRHDRTLRWFTASTISGKRSLQSMPVR